MNMLTGNILFLWLIILIQSFVIVYVITIVRRVSEDVHGLPPGNKFPNILNTNKLLRNKLLPETIFKDNEYVYFFVVEEECKFCREIIPKVDHYKRQNPNVNIQFLVIGDSDSAKRLMSISKYKFNYWILNPENVVKHLKVRSFPFVFIVQKDNYILKRSIINAKNFNDFMVSEVSKIAQ